MQAKYIKIDFSASALGPRNGVAALDMVSAALHVVTGDATINFQSGVGFFEEDMVVDRTANLRCPYVPKVDSSTVSYTNCGITNTLAKTPERVVALHQGSVELMLAMGLEDKMVGVASANEKMWPRYKEAYDKIPILSPKGLPTEQQIMAVQPDFIVGAYGSAFAELRCDAGEDCATADSGKGIYSDVTVGPCDGENSDFFPAGDPEYRTPYSSCRPQLHDNGIGTWLWVDCTPLPPPPPRTQPLAACRA